jgi:hypothetical protein
MKALLFSCCFVALTAGSAVAQSVAGDWKGTLRPPNAELRLVVHIMSNDKGELSGSMDSLDQGARGIPIDRVSVKDGKLTFDVDRVRGRYEGTVEKDKKIIRGTWMQGEGSLPLDLEPYVEEKKAARTGTPSDIDGEWAGTLDAMGQPLKLVLHVVNNADNKLEVTMDVPDQGAKGIPAQVVTREGNKITIEFRGIGARYAGTLNSDLNSVEGKWTQGQFDAALTLKRDKK